MKRRLVMMLTAVMITSLTACGSPSGDTNMNDKESKVEDTVVATEQVEEPESEVVESETIETEVVTEDTETTETEQESETEEEKKVEESDEKDSDKKDLDKKDSDKKDTDKKDTDKKDTDKKDSDSKNSGESSKKPNKTKKPAKKPNKTEKPSKKPEKNEKPDDTETNEEQKKETVANTLMSDFKSIAKSQNAESIANQLIANKIIPFMPAVMPVEEGLLNGFGDAEITGFKEGAMFGPMIGTIPFIGYVFELKDETDVNQFISTLKSNADLRWNICTEADEMVVCSVDKKVFFVMCPKYFEE